MSYIKYILTGILFGIVFTKAEIISWYRIYEMFRFESFHMYGVIVSALFLSLLANQLIKQLKIKDINGDQITFAPKDKTWKRYLFGGMIFGLGWALTGACPGPMFTLVGAGALVFIVVIAAAVFGTFCYGWLRKYLPH